MTNNNEQKRKENLGEKGLKIKRIFTANKKNRYEGIEFEKRVSKITNPDGTVVFEMKNVEVPKTWSQIATDILAQKYLRKKGVPQKDENGNIILDIEGNPVLGSETSAKEAVDRLAKAWRWWGEKYGYFDTKEDADAFEDEIAYMLITQMAAPNSPQWFNTGLSTSYGIKGKSQGHWYVDPETKEIKESQDAYTRTQAHACFILSIDDDLVNRGGIFDMLTAEARIFKYGSGSGINFSNIRGEGEPLSGGGKSSGLMSFLKIFDTAAGAIKSGGTTRRAAKMVCLNMDHPEIEKFIEWKVTEERKVVSLVTGSHLAYEHLKKIMQCAYEKGIDPDRNLELKQLIKKAEENYVPLNYVKRILMLIENGVKPEEFTFEKFDTDFRSEAYSTVSGQNSNNSVRITNEFFEKLLKDEEWTLTNRTNGTVYKTLKAKELWDKIVRAAWESADPGVQYDTTINEWHTCPEDGRINGSNPCSEYMFLDNTACNLASLNLLSFYDTETGKFKIEEFKHATRLWTIVLEISVLMAHLPTKAVAENTYLFRTLGLGYGNLGALLMQMGIPYESEKGYAITASITALMSGESYATSAEMAKYLGAFERYNKNKEHMLRVIRNHRRAIYSSPQSDYESLTIKPMHINYNLVEQQELVESARNAWDEALEMGEIYGYRNAQTTLIAPTGTIGLLMDFDTTGIEPDFALVKYKKLVGGGYFKIINQSVKPALKRLGYSDEEITNIEKYILGHGTLLKAPYINHETLIQKGFSNDKIQELESNIQFAYDLRSMFSKWNIDEKYLKEHLKIPENEFNKEDFDLLKYLGYTEEQIEKAEEYIFGTMTIEGAPHLKEKDLPVFDCANKCGKKGTRYISTIGHIKQMAAAQPFLSGAISKTVNLPENATFKDIEDAYLIGWKLMLKSNALYRDGSKLSQPLTTGDENSKYSKLFDFSDIKDESENNLEKEIEIKQVQKVIEKEIYKPIRKKLPDERHSITHKFSVSGHEGYITVGLFEDGNPGEVFIKMSTAGSFLAGIMDAFAISLSMNLQYGVPLESLVKNLTNLKFEPSGMTSNKEIPMAKSIIDYIGRWMALKFLDPEIAKLYHNEELVEKSYKEGSNYRLLIPIINGKGYTELVKRRTQTIEQNEKTEQSNSYQNERKENELELQKIKNDNIENLIEPIQLKLNNSSSNNQNIEEEYSMYDKIKKAKSMGYTGEVCKVCGSMNLRKNGSCSVCIDCGTTTGCS